MTEEHLLEKYKNILALGHNSGFNCWSGWYSIINDMLATMDHSMSVPFDLKVVQIKEKFGTLRVYIAPRDPYTQGIIDMAETISKHICERCGEPGEMRTGIGWHKTLCLNHYTCRKLELETQKEKE